MSISIADNVDNLKAKLVATRRDFHMHPELAGEEKRTSGIVAERLREAGLEVTTGVGGYGVVGILHGQQAGPVVAWRADMDAFPSEDTLDVPYKSQVSGVKHVCGHDVHTTIGLGIAEVLSKRRDDFAGTIKFIFQPAEENATGARAMVQDGVLENPRPEAIFGLHVTPLPVGVIGSVSGMVLPGMTFFTIEYGDTEATQPEVEAITQKILERLASFSVFPMSIDTLLKTVFTPGAKLETTVLVGGWPIVDDVSGKIKSVKGLMRTTGGEQWRSQTREKIEQALNELREKSPVPFRLVWPETATLPDTINDKHLEKSMRKVISKQTGQENLLLMNNPVPLNSEDFSIYLQQIPGVFYWLGVANEARGITGVPHTPDFDVDEDSIMVGVRVMANLLLDYLAHSN